MHDDLVRVTQAVGDHPRIKILGTLVIAGEDLNATEILERTDLSKGGFYNHIDDLVADDLVRETRKVGNSQLYAPTDENDVISGLEALFSELDDE